MDTVSFPNLGIEVSISAEAFNIFGVSVHWYGLIIASGVLLAIIVTNYLTKHYPKVEKDPFLDVVLVSVVCGFIGARIYYVIFSLDMYKDNWLRVFYFWEGGLGIYGGVIGALIAAVVTCKIRKVDIPSFVDLGAIGLFIGQTMGRWGNFFNQEAFGDNTTSLFGMTSDKISAYLTRNQASLEAMGTIVDPDLPVHPTFLYESVWCFIGLIIALAMVKRRKFNGQVFAFYIAWYSFGRFFIEGLRTDSLMLGPLKASQIVAVVGIIAGIAIFILGNKKAKALSLKPLTDGYQPKDSNQEDADDKSTNETFAEKVSAETNLNKNSDEISDLIESEVSVETKISEVTDGINKKEAAEKTETEEELNLSDNTLNESEEITKDIDIESDKDGENKASSIENEKHLDNKEIKDGDKV